MDAERVVDLIVESEKLTDEELESRVEELAPATKESLQRITESIGQTAILTRKVIL